MWWQLLFIVKIHPTVSFEPASCISLNRSWYSLATQTLVILYQETILINFLITIHHYFKRTKMALFNKNMDINSTRHFLCKRPKQLKYLDLRLYDFIKFIILNKDIWIWIFTCSCYSRLRSKKIRTRKNK